MPTKVIGRVKNGVVYKGEGNWRDGAGGVRDRADGENDTGVLCIIVLTI